jgi:hypothetical protein
MTASFPEQALRASFALRAVAPPRRSDYPVGINCNGAW